MSPASAGRRWHNNLCAIYRRCHKSSRNILESCYKSPMTTALEGLPDDLDGLRAAVLAMHAELAAERAERRRVEDQNERLRHFIRQLQRMQFGRRSAADITYIPSGRGFL